MAKRSRTIPMQIYFSQEEADSLKQKMESAGYSNFSAYARKMLLDGHVNKVDFSDLKKLISELGNLNRNLHQIVYRAALVNDLHEEDYKDILKNWERARDLINRYFYRIIRTHGEAYKPRGSDQEKGEEDGDHEDLGD